MRGNGAIEDGGDEISLDAPRDDRDRDGAASLRDVEEETGDEGALEDLFDLDEKAAREVGGDFAGDRRDEPRLD